jgi:hypothetical protein
MGKIDAQGRATDATLPEGEQEFRASEAQPVDDPIAVPEEEPADDKSTARAEPNTPKRTTTRK